MATGVSRSVGFGYIGATPPGPTAQQLQTEQYRKQAEEATRKKQEELNAAERERMAMEASRMALENARRLGSDPNSRITTTGNEQEVSNYGGGSSSYGSSSSYGGGSGGSPAGGGGGAMDTAAVEALLAKYAPSPAAIAPPPPPPQIAAPVAPTRAANTAKAFANAKNISGRQGQAAIRALRDTMTRRGMSDSGLEASGEADILGNVANFNSDAAFRSDLADDERTWEAAQLGFQGALGQRNADMGYLQGGYQGQLQQRGQDLDRTSLILNLLGRRY